VTLRSFWRQASSASHMTRATAQGLLSQWPFGRHGLLARISVQTKVRDAPSTASTISRKVNSAGGFARR
jgi:hypothetical protein